MSNKDQLKADLADMPLAQSGRKPRKERRALADIRQENVTHIISTAERLFAEKGFSGTTLAAIAEEANLPKANVLYYFHNKAGLYQAVLDHILVVWMDDMKSMTEDVHPKEALRNYILAKVQQSKEYPHASKIFATEVIHGAENIRELLGGKLKQQFLDTCRVIRSWIAKGWMDPINPEHLLFMLWSSTQTYADFSAQITTLLGKAEMADEEYENAVELITRVVLKGCGIKTV
ncbi:TetR/AcrR family transcriptional regulator [Pokkaliibacter plantistimulans]|nr:TetR/AcrR family transcriptional regulator [Pokkaliibacter plantistimulans]